MSATAWTFTYKSQQFVLARSERIILTGLSLPLDRLRVVSGLLGVLREITF